MCPRGQRGAFVAAAGVGLIKRRVDDEMGGFSPSLAAPVAWGCAVFDGSF